MLIEENTLIRIDPEDIVDGLFTTPDEVLYVNNYLDVKNINKMVLPNVRYIDNDFLYWSRSQDITIIEIPNVEFIGNFFLYWNYSLETLYAPKVKEIGEVFLYNNSKFKYTPNIIKAIKGNIFIDRNEIDKREFLRKINLDKILR